MLVVLERVPGGVKRIVAVECRVHKPAEHRPVLWVARHARSRRLVQLLVGLLSETPPAQAVVGALEASQPLAQTTRRRVHVQQPVASPVLVVQRTRTQRASFLQVSNLVRVALGQHVVDALSLVVPPAPVDRLGDPAPPLGVPVRRPQADVGAPDVRVDRVVQPALVRVQLARARRWRRWSDVRVRLAQPLRELARPLGDALHAAEHRAHRAKDRALRRDRGLVRRTRHAARRERLGSHARRAQVGPAQDGPGVQRVVAHDRVDLRVELARLSAGLDAHAHDAAARTLLLAQPSVPLDRRAREPRGTRARPPRLGRRVARDVHAPARHSGAPLCRRLLRVLRVGLEPLARRSLLLRGLLAQVRRHHLRERHAVLVHGPVDRLGVEPVLLGQVVDHRAGDALELAVLLAERRRAALVVVV